MIYLTSNPDKMHEAKEFFEKKHGLKVEILNPDFEPVEIQAETCAEVVAYTVKDAAERLGKAVVKSDAGFYVDALGGLPGPYSKYFDKQIGIEKFLYMLKDETNRKARIEHCWAYCEPGQEPKVFIGGSDGTIAMEESGKSSRWVDKFFIPDGETRTISAIRDENYEEANKYWGDAKQQLVNYLLNKEK